MGVQSIMKKHGEVDKKNRIFWRNEQSAKVGSEKHHIHKRKLLTLQNALDDWRFVWQEVGWLKRDGILRVQKIRDFLSGRLTQQIQDSLPGRIQTRRDLRGQCAKFPLGIWLIVTTISRRNQQIFFKSEKIHGEKDTGLLAQKGSKNVIFDNSLDAHISLNRQVTRICCRGTLKVHAEISSFPGSPAKNRKIINSWWCA